MEINQTLVVLLIIVIFLLVGIIIGIFFFAYKFLYEKSKNPSATALSDLENKMISLKEKQKERQLEYFCVNHSTIEGVGMCSICSDTFCDKCLKNLDNLNFCPEHFKLYNENEWEEIDSVKSSSETPEMGIELYKFKTQKWKENEIPSFIMTHYKINLHEDLIESYVKLFVISSSSHLLKEELKSIKKGD